MFQKVLTPNKKLKFFKEFHTSNENTNIENKISYNLASNEIKSLVKVRVFCRNHQYIQKLLGPYLQQ